MVMSDEQQQYRQQKICQLNNNRLGRPEVHAANDQTVFFLLSMLERNMCLLGNSYKESA